MRFSSCARRSQYAAGWLLAAACAGAAGAAPSGAAPEVPMQVSTVWTSPFCEAPGFSGLCRVVVVHEGFEHVKSRLWLEWLTARENAAPQRVRRVAVPDVGMWVLAPSPAGFEGRRVHFSATHTHSMETRTRVLEFGPPGQYRWIDETQR